MNLFKKKISNYVSETDIFLKNFDKNHPQHSLSQQKEISKHARIAKCRDQKQSAGDTKDIWVAF